MNYSNNFERGILFTDQYELTMAQLYFENGVHETPVQFDHFYRRNPDYGKGKAGFCIYAGLETFVNWLFNTKFSNKEVELLKSQRSSDNKRIFSDEFLKYLKNNWSMDQVSLDAVEEGKIAHPNTPLTVVRAPLFIAQIIETALLNIINYQTLIATKACRIKQVCKNGQLIEFGTRRGHAEGSIQGARAALIGGADFTSQVGISHKIGIAPKGTHIHSMIQFFITTGMSELDAFRKYSNLYPDNTILLVDTIDTLNSGLPNAIKVFEEMKKAGHSPTGIRLDSGDLASLSVESSKMLDNAGFKDCVIVLSNELDEFTITDIHNQIKDKCEEKKCDADRIINRLAYGVGTNLITSAGSPSLSGVYKLSAVKKSGKWKASTKISDSSGKTTIGGRKHLYRLFDKNNFSIADLLSLQKVGAEQNTTNLYSYNEGNKKIELNYHSSQSLHKKIIKDGKLMYRFNSLDKTRELRDSDLSKLDNKYKEIYKPAEYPLLVTSELLELQNQIKTEMKKGNS